MASVAVAGVLIKPSWIAAAAAVIESLTLVTIFSDLKPFFLNLGSRKVARVRIPLFSHCPTRLFSSSVIVLLSSLATCVATAALVFVLLRGVLGQ